MATFAAVISTSAPSGTQVYARVLTGTVAAPVTSVARSAMTAQITVGATCAWELLVLAWDAAWVNPRVVFDDGVTAWVADGLATVRVVQGSGGEIEFDTDLGDNVQTIADAIDVGGVNVTVSAPVDPDDDDRLTLIQGDDHATGDRLPSWTITGYTGPSLASGTAVLRLIEIATYRKHGANASAVLSVTATVSQASTTVTCTAAITAAQSALLSSYPPGDEATHEYQLVATTSGGAIVTLKLGPVTVRRRINT